MKRDDYLFIQRCLAGDRDAFKHLVENHQKKVYDTVFRMVFNHETAKDLSQETFVKAYVKLHTFDPRYPFRVWIQRIAAHCAIDFLRRKKPEYLILDNVTESRKTPLSQQIPSGELPQDESMEKAETADLVQKAVQKLDPKLRSVIILRHFRDMNYGEIAETLQIPLGTVKNRIFRAREKLHDFLIEDQLIKEEVYT